MESRIVTHAQTHRFVGSGRPTENLTGRDEPSAAHAVGDPLDTADRHQESLSRSLSRVALRLASVRLRSNRDVDAPGDGTSEMHDTTDGRADRLVGPAGEIDRSLTRAIRAGGRDEGIDDRSGHWRHETESHER